MNNHVSQEIAIARIDEAGLGYEILDIGKGMSVLALERGARLFGPFENPQSESILWMNRFWNDRSDFCREITGGAYDLGGERFWLEPEFAFFTKDKKRFHETYTVQPSIDPGNYSMERRGEQIIFHMDVDCEVFEMPIDKKTFSIKKEITPSLNPIRHINSADSLMDGIDYGGYTIGVTLADTSIGNNMLLAPWFLAQVNPGGHVIVPITGPFEYVDFYEPVTEEYQTYEDGYVRLKITGDRRYKTAYRSAQTFGRAAYLNETADGRTYAFIRNYYNDPSQPYCAEPFNDLGNVGCSLYFYNDSGKLGGFAEIENSGIPIGSVTGKTEITCSVNEWFYIGERSKITGIVDILLGTNLGR
jgi:hypothetical protein